MPFQDFRFLTDAFARLGIKPPAGFNPGQMSTSAAGTLSDIVSDPSGSARLDRARTQGVLNIDAARQRGVGPANPIKGFNVSSTNPLGRGVTAPTIGTASPRPPIVRPTITGSAPNTFGAPYIRDPGLARQFTKGGLPRNVPRSLVPGTIDARPRGLGGTLGTALTFGPIIGQGAIALGEYLRSPQGELLKENFANPVRFLQQQYQNMINPPVRLEQFDADVSIEEDIKNTKKGSLDPAPVAPVAPVAPAFPAPAPAPALTPVVTAPLVPGQQAGNAGAMETYMQLQAQAKTPEDYKRLDQLGMAIHQEKFGTPQMRMEKTIGTFNPLMAQMGLQQPARGVQPDKEALVDRMDQQALEAQEFLRKLTKFNKKDEK